MDATHKNEWAELQRMLDEEDAARERIIKEMRETQKSSKAAIFAAQRGDVTTARAKLQQGLEVALRIKPLVDTHPHLRHGTYSAALEEYGEGVAFLQFVQHGTLVRFADFGGLLTPEEYLGAVSDLTGEMQRYAVLRATARDVEAVKRCRDVTDDILAAMMSFNLRNGNLRKKSDAIKYSLKRFETILYELSLVPDNRKLDAATFAEDREPKRSKTDGDEGDDGAADAE